MEINVKSWYDDEVDMRVKSNENLVLLVLLLIGGIFGSLIGDALGSIVPILNYGKSIGVDPFVLDLNVIVITFGFKLSMNIAGILGIVIAFIIFKKL